MTGLLDPFAARLWERLHYLSPLVLLWLAFVFGGTLRRGGTPLIEQIARRSNATLSPPLCRYTRRLTAIWCGYFAAAATLAAVIVWSGGATFGRFGLAILAGSALLFVGERFLRPLIFPHETFPGLLRQLRDTWSTWRSHGTGSDARR